MKVGEIMNVLIVFAGGGAGAALRYLISSIPVKSVFPFTTLLVNLLGAIAIGVVVGLAAEKGLGERWTLFLKTGVCGGFTTFSTFSLEAFGLFEAQYTVLGVVYITLSVLLCLGGIALGKLISA